MSRTLLRRWSDPDCRVCHRLIHPPKENMNPLLLSDAITGVETAASAYSAASTTTASDQANAAAIQTKLDAANAQIATDVQAQNSAATAFNASLDILISAASAAKVPVN